MEPVHGEGGAAVAHGVCIPPGLTDRLRLERLEKAQAALAKEVANVVRLLKKPLHVTIKGR